MARDEFNPQDFGGRVFAEDTPEGKPPRTWDFFLTIFLIFVLLVLAVIFEVLGVGLTVSTITCGDSAVDCNYQFISIGSLITIIGVPVVALVGIVLAVVWIARRKVSFLMPLIAAVLIVGVFLLGSWIVDLAVPAT
ncbi:hypothetical protein BH11ACT4_BH11ACT4_07300 [soil metagenome]